MFRNKMKQTLTQFQKQNETKSSWNNVQESEVNSRPRAPVVARDSSLTRAVPRILCLSGVGNKGTSFRLLFEHSCKLFPDVVPLWCRFFRLPMIELILPLSPGTTTNVSIWGSVNTCRLQVALQMDDPHHQSVNQQNKIKLWMTTTWQYFPASDSSFHWAARQGACLIQVAKIEKWMATTYQRQRRRQWQMWQCPNTVTASCVIVMSVACQLRVACQCHMNCHYKVYESCQCHMMKSCHKIVKSPGNREQAFLCSRTESSLKFM